MTNKWTLDDPFIPALSETPIRFLLRNPPSGDMDGVVYPGPVWVPSDNSRGFTPAELRQIAGVLDGA